MTLEDRILQGLGEAGVRMARRALSRGSKTLRDAMRFERTGRLSGRLFVPHYWALYHHDGRGTVLPNKRWLVWYVDPKDDPRLRGGYPVRLSDIKKLTQADFDKGRAENRARHKANPTGGWFQFMRLMEFSGPTRPSKSYPFFTRGMEDFPKVATSIIDRQMRSEFRLLAKKERSRVLLRL